MDSTEAVPIPWLWLTVILQEIKMEALAFLALVSWDYKLIIRGSPYEVLTDLYCSPAAL